MKIKNSLLAKCILPTLVLFFVPFAWVQAQTNKIEGSAIFVSSVDKELTIQTVTLYPAIDNISGIYAKPLEEHLKNLITEEKQWSVSDYKKSSDKTSPPEDLENNPKQVAAILKIQGVNALITLRVTRGPGGVSIRMNLFSGEQGLLLSQETMLDYQGFETDDLKEQLTLLYKRLRRKMPYQGMVLSRRGNEVTMNIGSKMGVKTGDELTAIQIFKANRHPKFKFILSTEKEILGQIKVTKSEETLSFGTITTERDLGVVRPDMKVLTKDFVIYPEKPLPVTDTPTPVVPESPADEPPTFGSVALLGGLSTYSYNTELESNGSIEGSSSIAPTFTFEGEVWITPTWIVEARIRQAILSMKNPLSGSSPSNVNVSLGSYSVHFGYNLLLHRDFFGPKFQALFGIGSSSTYVDSSSPKGLTTTNQGGISLGLRGSFPFEKTPYTAGAELFFYLTPSLSESPRRSGSAKDPSINQFAAFLEYKMRERLRLKGSLGFDLVSANFKGNSDSLEDAESLSQKMMTLSGGAEFLF